MELLAEYERGETEYLAPMCGLCRECSWPLEDDQSQPCRKCAAAGAKKAAGWGFLRRGARAVGGGGRDQGERLTVAPLVALRSTN